MPTIAFAKGHGTGNDFVLFVDADGETPLSSTLVRSLCDRHTGIGADGVIRAVRSSALPEGVAVLAEEPEAEWFMDYWNADGTTAAMCGNGIRVFAHFLIEEGLVAPGPNETLPVGTRSGVRDVLPVASGYTVDLGPWRLGSPHVATEPVVSAVGLDVPRPGLAVYLGNSHVVAALASEGELDSLRLSEAPVVDPAPTEGVNVEFVVPEEQLIKNGVAQIRMRVHEAGSGETQSCGTGAAAAALAFRHWGGEDMPNSWNVAVPGGKLAVRMFSTPAGERVSLSGPAEIVYRGEIELP